MKKFFAWIRSLFGQKQKQKPRVPIVRGKGKWTKRELIDTIQIWEVFPYPASIGFLTKTFVLNEGSRDWFQDVSGATSRTLKKITEEFHAEAEAQVFPHEALKVADGAQASHTKNILRRRIADKYKKYRRAKGAEILEERNEDEAAVRDVLAEFAAKKFVGVSGWLGASYYTGRVAFAPLPDGTRACAREILTADIVDGKKVVARSWQGGSTYPYELPFSFDVLARYGNAVIRD